MFGIVKRLSMILASSAVVAVLCMPAHAAGIGVGAGASVGGSGVVNAGVSIGGGNGVNAGLGASVGAKTVLASAQVSVSVRGVGIGVGGTNPSTPSDTSNLSKPGLPGVVADM